MLSETVNKWFSLVKKLGEGTDQEIIWQKQCISERDWFKHIDFNIFQLNRRCQQFWDNTGHQFKGLLGLLNCPIIPILHSVFVSWLIIQTFQVLELLCKLMILSEPTLSTRIRYLSRRALSWAVPPEHTQCAPAPLVYCVPEPCFCFPSFWHPESRTSKLWFPTASVPASTLLLSLTLY